MPKYQISGEKEGRTKELGTVEAGGIGHALHDASVKWPGYKYTAKRVPEKGPINKRVKEVKVK